MNAVGGKVYIVLVNWNGVQDTLECLESVLRLDYPNFQVVVCDNNSSDDSVVKILDWGSGRGVAIGAQNPALDHLLRPNIVKPVAIDVLSRVQAEDSSLARSTARVVVIRTGANLGFAGANNIGMRYGAIAGDAEYFWLLNNDTVVEPRALASLVARADRCGDRGIVGSTLVFYHQHDKLQALGVGTYSRKKALSSTIGANFQRTQINNLIHSLPEVDADFVVGASMLVPREFYKLVGPMCEDFFIYFEELDWSLRGRMFGFSCHHAVDSIVYHKVGATTMRRGKGDLSVSVRYSYINRLRVTKMHFRRELPWVRLRILLEALQALAGGRWREAKFAAALALRPVPQ